MEQKYCFGCMQHVDDPEQVCPYCGFDPAGYEIDPHQLQPGTILHDRYMVGKVIGEGGFGITYVGRDTLLDMKVAVKEFYMNGFVNRNNTVSMLVQASVGTNAELFEKNKEKFIDEARVLARFADEDGIVGIRDFFEENNTAYMIMDFLEGQTLRAYLEKNGKMMPDDVIRIMRPVMNSLQNVHEQNVIHRDISPDNIMMLKNGRVKLLDFGAAREISKTDIRSLSVILKPGYAPEEQYRSKGMQGPWTDVYALCATMYRCIAGVTPDEAMERMFNDNLAPLSDVSACTPSVSSVIMKGLSVRQEGRYRSVRELQQDLERALCDPAFRAAAAETNGKRMPNGDVTIYAGGDAVTQSSRTEAARQTVQTQGTQIPSQTHVTATRPQNTVSQTQGSKTGTGMNPSKTISQVGGSVTYVDPVQTGSSEKTDGGTGGQTVKKKKKKWWLIPVIAVPVLLILIVGIIVVGSLAGKSGKGIPPTMDEYQFELNGVKYRVPLLYADLEKEGWEFEDPSVAMKELTPGGSETLVNLINGYGRIKASFYNPTESTLPLREAEIDLIYVHSVGLNDNYLNEERNTFSCVTNTENTFLTLGQTVKKDLKAYKKYAEVKGNAYVFEQDSQHRIEVDFTGDTVTTVILKNREADFIASEILQSAPEYDAQALLMELPVAVSDTRDGSNAVLTCGVQVKELVNEAGWTIEKAPEYLGSRMEGEVFLRLNTTTTAVVKAYNPFDNPLVTGECIVTGINTTLYVETQEPLWYVGINGTVYDAWNDTAVKDLKMLGFEETDSGVFTGDTGAKVTVYLNDDASITGVALDAKTSTQQFFDSLN